MQYQPQQTMSWALAADMPPAVTYNTISFHGSKEKTYQMQPAWLLFSRLWWNVSLKQGLILAMVSVHHSRETGVERPTSGRSLRCSCSVAWTGSRKNVAFKVLSLALFSLQSGSTPSVPRKPPNSSLHWGPSMQLIWWKTWNSNDKT